MKAFLGTSANLLGSKVVLRPLNLPPRSIARGAFRFCPGAGGAQSQRRRPRKGPGPRTQPIRWRNLRPRISRSSPRPGRVAGPCGRRSSRSSRPPPRWARAPISSAAPRSPAADDRNASSRVAARGRGGLHRRPAPWNLSGRAQPPGRPPRARAAARDHESPRVRRGRGRNAAVHEYDLGPVPAGTGGNASVTATLDSITEPSGARVSIDGRPRGTTPLVLTDLAPGPGMKSSSRTARPPVRRQVRLGAGPTMVLMPATAPHRWPSRSSPDGSASSLASRWTWYEDERLIGTSAIDRIMLPAGSHTLRLVSRPLNFEARKTDGRLISGGQMRIVKARPAERHAEHQRAALGRGARQRRSQG